MNFGERETAFMSTFLRFVLIEHSSIIVKPLSAQPRSVTSSTRKSVFTSSTCSVVNGPPYLLLPRSIREGRSSSDKV